MFWPTIYKVGIAYGWNTSVQKEVKECETNACLHLEIRAVTGACPSGQYRMSLELPNPHQNPEVCAGAGSRSNYCVEVVRQPNCTDKNYCAAMPHEYVGDGYNWWTRAKVYNNSICNVGVGVNIVGGNVDVHHNLVTRHADVSTPGFGLSPDGHWPNSESTTFYENYVHGFPMGFLTDGSQYMAFDRDEIWRSSASGRRPVFRNGKTT
jgi:hypothetical protein